LLLSVQAKEPIHLLPNSDLMDQSWISDNLQACSTSTTVISLSSPPPPLRTPRMSSASCKATPGFGRVASMLLAAPWQLTNAPGASLLSTGRMANGAYTLSPPTQPPSLCWILLDSQLPSIGVNPLKPVKL